MSACLDTTRQLTRGTAILFTVMLTSLSGCGGSDSGPDIDMIPVSGSVAMDGQPLVGAMVEFHPTGGTKGNGGFGLTDEAGKFTLTDFHSNPGCPPGEYGRDPSRSSRYRTGLRSLPILNKVGSG